MKRNIIKKTFVIVAAFVVIATTAWAVVMYIIPTAENPEANGNEINSIDEQKSETITQSGAAKEINLKTSLNIIGEEDIDK